MLIDLGTTDTILRQIDSVILALPKATSLTWHSPNSTGATRIFLKNNQLLPTTPLQYSVQVILFSPSSNGFKNSQLYIFVL